MLITHPSDPEILKTNEAWLEMSMGTGRARLSDNAMETIRAVLGTTKSRTEKRGMKFCANCG